MNLTVKEVVDLARVELADSTKLYWTDQELLDYLNEGRDAILVGIPRIYETTEIVTLLEGPRQSLPNASQRLFNVQENITADSRRFVTPTNRETLSRVRPGWRGEDASDEIFHYVYVETEPTIYEVYPPAMAGTQVRISYAKPPVKLTISTDYTPGTTILTAERELARALVHFVVGKAFAKQSDTSPDAGQRSQQAMGMFTALVQAEDAGKRDSSHNTTAIGGKPTEATNR
jgi:hypothetical protein